MTTDRPSSAVATIPRILPMVVSVAPPYAPPDAAISRSTRLPIVQANGPHSPQTTTPRMPRTSTVTACGCWGGCGA